jgi:hypothetical protein
MTALLQPFLVYQKGRATITLIRKTGAPRAQRFATNLFTLCFIDIFLEAQAITMRFLYFSYLLTLLTWLPLCLAQEAALLAAVARLPNCAVCFY